MIKEEKFERKHRVFFVRNGQTTFRRGQLLTGWRDTFLSLDGIKEAHAASQEFINNGYNHFDAVFTSNLSRGRKFAEILLKDLGLKNTPVYHSWRLNERHHGWFTGFKTIDIAHKYGTQQSIHWYATRSHLPKMTENHEYYTGIVQSALHYGTSLNYIPECETIEACAQRILPYWENFIGPIIKSNKRILVVVHEQAFRALVKVIEQIDKKDLLQIKLPAASIPIYYDVNDNLVAKTNMTFLCTNEKKQAWIADCWQQRSRKFQEMSIT